MDVLGFEDWTKTHPWRAPGTAAVHSPCGIDGGNPTGCPAGNPSPAGCAGGGYGHGPDARAFNFTDVVTTDWKRGSVVEAAWGITANRENRRPLLHSSGQTWPLFWTDRL